MMAWLNGHTDRFKAMVCHAGVYNWHSMMASDFVKGRERALGRRRGATSSKIDRQSPQRFAANFKTPTLVMHGEKDFRVPVTQGLEYYNTLRQKGVPTRLVYFPDENHWVLKPQNSLLWHREVFAWLEKYIGTGPEQECSDPSLQAFSKTRVAASPDTADLQPVRESCAGFFSRSPSVLAASSFRLSLGIFFLR